MAVALVAGSAPQAHAQGLLDAACTVGSKFPIVDYQDYPTNSVGRGHNMAAFLRGKDASNADKDYMMLVWSRDSGKGEGGISFWNWDTPATWSAPTKKKHLVASQLREAHSTPVTNMFAPDWRTWVLQATPGFSVYNLASVATPAAGDELRHQWGQQGRRRVGSDLFGWLFRLVQCRQPSTTAAARSGSSRLRRLTFMSRRQTTA